MQDASHARTQVVQDALRAQPAGVDAQDGLADLILSAREKIDIDAPLLAQLHRLTADEYEAWVHAPYLSYVTSAHPLSPRLFGWAALEACTHTPWWLVPLVWLPVAAALAAPALTAACAHDTHWLISAVRVAALGGCGLAAGITLAWPLFEYGVHALLFHARPADAPLARVLHFLLHGVHHTFPRDATRLVMPPPLFAALLLGLGGPLYTVLVAATGLLHAHVFRFGVAVMVLAYVAYDMTHYALHHNKESGVRLDVLLGRARFDALRTHHARHHYARGHNANFGVTTTWTDAVFGTMLRSATCRPHARQLHTHAAAACM